MMRPFTVPRKLGLLALTLPMVLLFCLLPSRADQDKSYVGSETCVGCHTGVTPALVKGFNHTLHGKVLADNRLPENKRGCEACHGPGSQHVANPPEPGSTGITDLLLDPAKVLQDLPDEKAYQGRQDAILNPRKLPAGRTDSVCLKCHWSGQDHQNWDMGMHSREGVGCVSCHDLHRAGDTPRLLRKPSTEALCFSCHKDQKHRFTLTSRHPVLEGKVSCVSCHNPHGSGNNTLLVKERNGLCITCHANYAGPYAVEHLPAGGTLNSGCLDCHQPHGSANRRLLTLTDRGTCLQCHANRVNHKAGQNCLFCHPYIHGSNTNSTVPFSQP